ncbi:TRAP transporter substrate-binding protein DctP [Paracoccus aminovorans]|uniref:TRAP transporter substrate-binding protein DctP n=1 Tax=Paracoccus aminovorans TaxID=34004 RepID=UPI0009E71E78|nr:TRAP transporter substrate-binding protein DctP [Paracoccus aminovorans]MDQ7777149.1 TRAP transporter substrate-binding protein DctP [Paracoccus aminovorans]
MTRFAAKLALATALAAMTGGAALAEEWKFAIEEIPGSIMDSYAQDFKKRIEAATGGEVTVTIYPLGSLGTPTEVAEQTADGVIQLSNLSVGNLGTIVPESQVFLSTYLLPSDMAEVNRFLAESPTVHGALAEAFAAKGLKLGALYSEGEQVWTTRKEIRTPEDMANFKMRVMVSPMLLKAYEDLGASATPIPFGEVYGALQLGQVDGQVNPVSTIQEMKFYEVTDYMIWAGEQQLLTAVMASDDWFQTLPPERQQLLDQTFAEMNGFITPVVQKFNAERLEAIKAVKPGIRLIELSEDERAAFRERAKATDAAVAGIVSAQGAELLQSLKSELGQ